MGSVRGDDAVIVPHALRCPISAELMQHPVVAADGHTYEHDMLLEWFKRGHSTSPLTAAPLAHTTLIPNQSIRSLIIEFCEQHPEHRGSDEPFSGPKGAEDEGAGADRRAASTSHNNNKRSGRRSATGTSASLASDFAAGSKEGATSRRAVVLAGVHQAEVHTRRLGVLPAYMALVAELESVSAVSIALVFRWSTCAVTFEDFANSCLDFANNI